ncbi:MAG: Cysteine desulfurase [Berkelbacteria bacterium GW2011_GWB1_38_5]|uniref:cysteine desulfurase n=2 Tax=Candidatus Berkelbacteria TaxID=1618330 RepID=A0A0G0K4L9_9BACT|nr:MAG: Cysteine desulfurase [Berkelbacteria bacterium GW2011_GWB1_38_5]
MRGISNSKVHIITTQIEHHAILKTCEDLEKNNIAEVTYLKPNREGLISALQVKKALKKNTVLVSVMYVNNEIGTVQPIREIGKMIEKENKNRLSKERIYFHTDAVQAVEYLNVNVDFLHVDLLTLSGHKIGATKGIGALYLRSGTPFEKIIFGGEQEMNLRAGTENVSGIVSLGKAIELIQIKNQKSNLKIKELRDYFIKKIITEIPEVELNGSRQFRSPNNANFYFKYVEGESILLSLDLVGIAASSGSACTSLSLKPSHVLMATYDDAERSHGSIRFTLGQETTKEEIDYTISNLKTIIKRLREISPLGSTK